MLQLQLWEGVANGCGECHSRCRPADGALVGGQIQTETGTWSTVDQRSVFEPRQNLPLAAAGMLRRWTNEEPANVSGKWRGVQ